LIGLEEKRHQIPGAFFLFDGLLVDKNVFFICPKVLRHFTRNTFQRVPARARRPASTIQVFRSKRSALGLTLGLAAMPD
jgi:hypothetical protein